MNNIVNSSSLPLVSGILSTLQSSFTSASRLYDLSIDGLQAALVGSEGGLARYRLSLVDWTWMLGQSGLAPFPRTV